MKNVFIINHPLVEHKLSILRHKDTRPELFRRLVKEITTIMGCEVTKDLPLIDVEVPTPIAIAFTKRLREGTPFIAVILRAGDGMKDAMLELLPTAMVGYIGLFRKEGSGAVEIKQYYNKLPADANQRGAIIVDPMIATGTSASHAITLLKQAGVRDIKFMCLVACEVGITKVTTDHPDVQFYCAAIDKDLLPNNYISPGLGDAGDRLYSIK